MSDSEKKEIIIRVGLDKDAIPESITWLAPGASKGEEKADAFMLSLFSGGEKSTLGIDLWTKEMLVGDMNIFFFQASNSMLQAGSARNDPISNQLIITQVRKELITSFR